MGSRPRFGVRYMFKGSTMSEQTPDSSNSAKNAEPSMEDILASIRKIIADDDKSTASNDSDSQIQSNANTTELLEPDTASIDALDVNDENSVFASLIDDNTDDTLTTVPSNDIDDNEVIDLAIPDSDDSVLDLTVNDQLDALSESYELDEKQFETEAVTGLTPQPTQLSNDELDLVDFGDDMDLTALDEMIEADASDIVGVVDTVSAQKSDIVTAEDLSIETAIKSLVEPEVSLIASAEMSDNDTAQVLDDIDIYVAENEDVIDPSEDMQIDAKDSESDLDLVKSLMADLTDTSFLDDSSESSSELSEFDDGIEAQLAAMEDRVASNDDIDAQGDMGGAELSNLQDDGLPDDVLQEILSLTIEDETSLSEQSLNVLEPEIELDTDVDITAATGEAENALQALAARAAADAQAAESMPVMVENNVGDADDIDLEAMLTGAAATVAGGAVVGAALNSSDDEISNAAQTELTTDSENNEIELVIDESPNTPHVTLEEETEDMPRAVKSDAIIDEVTESATAGAFASLNQVVEEKAVVAERGDRIGDIVMEALQPMLKEWLDANLKGIVERAVTKEVKRISSGK